MSGKYHININKALVFGKLDRIKKNAKKGSKEDKILLKELVNILKGNIEEKFDESEFQDKIKNLIKNSLSEAEELH